MQRIIGLKQRFDGILVSLIHFEIILVVFCVQRLEDGGIVEHVIGQVVIGFQLVFHGLHGLGESAFRQAGFPFQHDLIRIPVGKNNVA